MCVYVHVCMCACARACVHIKIRVPNLHKEIKGVFKRILCCECVHVVSAFRR